MGSLSIWHLLILLVLFGSPFALYFVIASGSRSDLRRPSTFLHASFIAWSLAIVAAIVATVLLTDPDAESLVVGILVIAFAVAGWAYLMALAILASRTGRSGILWAGLAFITSPIGVVVSYPMMIGALRRRDEDHRNAT